MNSLKNIPNPVSGPSLAKFPLLSGVAYSLLWLAIGALLLSLLLRFSSMKEDDLPLYAMLVHGFSACAGGFVSGKKSGQRGWYYGGLLGIVYSVIIIIISFLAVDAAIHSETLILVLSTLGAGAIGGMIGVNVKR